MCPPFLRTNKTTNMNITLYFKEGSSDKIYQACILPKDNGYAVNFAYGRRGSTLQTGSKTNGPVSFEAAKVIYDKLVREKTAKGYTVGESGTPYQNTDKADTGIRCQLLNSAEEDQMPELLENFTHWMQQKMDGVRCLIRKEGECIRGINHRGLTVSLPSSVISDCQKAKHNFLLDGEMVGDTFHAFDLLQLDYVDLRGKGFGDRYLWLLGLLTDFVHPSIKQVTVEMLPSGKYEAFHRLRLEEREGVVFKDSKSPYKSGRPASSGSQLKYKFVETASFIVDKINTKRSIGLSLVDDGESINVGNVTIPANHSIPALGSIVEVRYLYAFKGGSVYQPVYLGVRNDLTPEECTLDQLKYKAEALAA